MKMQRGDLIPDGSMHILTLTLALLGMAAPWRCQEHHRPSASSIGQCGQTSANPKQLIPIQKHIHTATCT